MYKDASHFHNIGENISKSLADNSLFFGDWFLLHKVSSSKVPFNIDMALKSDLIQQSHSKEIDIKDVLEIDAHTTSQSLLCMPG